MMPTVGFDHVNDVLPGSPDDPVATGELISFHLNDNMTVPKQSRWRMISLRTRNLGLDRGLGAHNAGGPRVRLRMAYVNQLVKSDPRAPAGGVKNSDYGCEFSQHASAGS